MVRSESGKIESPLTLFQEITIYVKYLSDIGCQGFECSEKTLTMIQDWGKPKTDDLETLGDIQDKIKDCRLCQLSKTRKRIVFGAGDPKAKLMFVGEGPGVEEEEQGIPFTGAVGDLLIKIIQAIGLSRDLVYLCNIVKCRTPGEREPGKEEVQACLTLLKRQIQTIKPDFICTLGSVATHALLDTTKPLSQLRGRFHNYQGIKIIPTYHPKRLLEYPEKKRNVWEDMKFLMHAYHKSLSDHN